MTIPPLVEYVHYGPRIYWRNTETGAIRYWYTETDEPTAAAAVRDYNRPPEHGWWVTPPMCEACARLLAPTPAQREYCGACKELTA